MYDLIGRCVVGFIVICVVVHIYETVIKEELEISPKSEPVSAPVNVEA